MDSKQGRKTGRTIMICGFVFIALNQFLVGIILAVLGVAITAMLGRCPHCGKLLFGVPSNAVQCPKCHAHL